MAALGVRGGGDGLPVGDAHLLGVHPDPELALQPFDGGAQMGFADPPQDGLVGLVVAFEAQRGVLVQKAAKGDAQLVVIGNRLGPDRGGQGGGGQRHGGHRDRLVLGGQGVSGVDVGQLGHGHDVPAYRRAGRALIAAQGAQKRVQANVGPRTGVEKVIVGGDAPREDLDQRKLAHMTIGDGLEHEAQRFTVLVGLGVDLHVAGEDLEGAAIQRRRTLFHDEVEQTIHPDAGGGAATHHWKHTGGSDTTGQSVGQVVEGRDVTVQVALQQDVVADHDALNEGVVDLVLAVGQLRRHGHRGADPVAVAVGGVGQQVGHAGKGRVGSDGQLQRGDPRPQLGLELVEHPVEIGPFLVEFVDEHRSGDASFGRQLPDELGLDLDPIHRADHEDG